jgi:hypothetical protein
VQFHNTNIFSMKEIAFNYQTALKSLITSHCVTTVLKFNTNGTAFVSGVTPSEAKALTSIIGGANW